MNIFLTAVNNEENTSITQKEVFPAALLPVSHLQHNAAVRTVTHTAAWQGSKGTRQEPDHLIRSLLAADAHKALTEDPPAISVSVTEFSGCQPRESLISCSCVGTSLPADHVNTGIILKLCTKNRSKWRDWHLKVLQEHMLGFLNWLQFLKQQIHKATCRDPLLSPDLSPEFPVTVNDTNTPSCTRDAAVFTC